MAPDQPLQLSKLDVVVPAIMTVTFHCLLKIAPLGTVLRLIGLGVKATEATEERLQSHVLTVRNRMVFVGSHYPKLGSCVPQCLAAATLLRLRGVRSTLHFGVIKPPVQGAPLKAHAWLSAGKIVVSGNGSSAVYQELAPLNSSLL